MDDASYLSSVLKSQLFDKDDEELKALRAKRDEVETVLREAFPGCGATIKYGGSHAKGTMNRVSYDLDIVNFFPRDQDGAGTTLEEIYNSVQAALAKHYWVNPKTSALRIEEQHGKERTYTHIDVVPGRYVDDSKTDVFMFQKSAEKCRLKTNTKTHVLHIRNSGFTPAIRLVKLWRETFGFKFKTFVLELLVVDILRDTNITPLDGQVRAFWQTVQENPDGLYVEDPANPNGNDLSSYIEEHKYVLAVAADTALRTLDSNGWEGIFGSIVSRSKTSSSIGRIPIIRPTGAKPWG